MSVQWVANQVRPNCKVFDVCAVCSGKYSHKALKLNSVRYDATVLNVAGISFYLNRHYLLF